MTRAAIAIAMTAGVIAVYVLRLDDVAGLYKDDAYYVVLAQSLARGDGYALVKSATAPILPSFPPGFALMLAPIFAAAPSYPDNLIWLKAVSIAAMIGTGLLTFRYLHGYRSIGAGRAATIAALTTLTPGLVFLATSTVMSECVFTFALIGSAIAIERAALTREPSRARRAIVLAALVTTAAWLIRSSGIALVGGGALFLGWKRGWRAAAGFLVACAIGYAPWAAYSATHGPTAADRTAYGGDSVRAFRHPLTIGIGPLSWRTADNVLNVLGRDVGALIFPAGYRGADESGLEAFQLAGSTGPDAGSMGIGPPFVAASGAVTLFVIAGAFAMARRRVGVAEFFAVLTILLVAVFTKEAVYRYMLPLAPLVIGYFLVGVESVATRLRAGTGPPAFRVAAACLLFFVIAEHGRYIWLKTQGPAPAWLRDGGEVRLVTDYINTHLPADAKVASTNPGLVYLLTGRRAVSYVEPVTNWPHWQRAGIRYAVALHAVPEPNRALGFRTLYESPRLGLWVLETVPPSGR
jgi:hypothetical protein